MDDLLRKKISVLVHLACVDDHLDIKEKAFIYNVCLRNGVPLDEIGDLIEKPDAIQLPGELDHESRKDYMESCLHLMLVDGRVLPKEINFCNEMGEMLGFQKEAVVEMVNQIDGNRSYTEEEIIEMVARLPLQSQI